jgi:hypothetical protein
MVSADLHPILCSKERFCRARKKCSYKVNLLCLGWRSADYFQSFFSQKNFSRTCMNILVLCITKTSMRIGRFLEHEKMSVFTGRCRHDRDLLHFHFRHFVSFCLSVFLSSSPLCVFNFVPSVFLSSSLLCVFNFVSSVFHTSLCV